MLGDGKEFGGEGRGGVLLVFCGPDSSSEVYSGGVFGGFAGRRPNLDRMEPVTPLDALARREVWDLFEAVSVGLTVPRRGGGCSSMVASSVCPAGP